LFGSTIQKDVFENVGNVKGSWETIVSRIAFLVIIGCHIPYIFFVGKTSILSIVDEIARRSISKELSEKLINV
jgi:hypothetical protein